MPPQILSPDVFGAAGPSAKAQPLGAVTAPCRAGTLPAVSSRPPAPSLRLELCLVVIFIPPRGCPCFSRFALLLHPCPALHLLVTAAAFGGSPAIFYITKCSVWRDLSKSREGRNFPPSTPLKHQPTTQKQTAGSTALPSVLLGPAGHGKGP